MEDFDLTTINSRINKCINNGTLGSGILDILIKNNKFVPKEGWLWDYKIDCMTDSVGLAKTILQIVSFHNTWGGYLIYGVMDKSFVPVSIKSKPNRDQLRDMIKQYTGVQIDISYGDVPDYLIDSSKYNFGIIHVPKRTSNFPVKFIKRGPEKRKNEYIFPEGSVYFRSLDECRPATSAEDWQFLFSGARDYEASFSLSAQQYVESIISHNLPDRKTICSQFVGRKEILSHLWEWFSDQFEYTRILAGEGGKGKNINRI